MNQKQKIIIFLSSLFCGTPIIFLSLKDHNNQPKNNKNNPSVVSPQKEEENKENNEDSSSSSFLFWTVLAIVIVFILIIIFGTIYKCRQNSNDDLSQHEEDDKSKGKEYNENLIFKKNPSFKKNSQLKENGGFFSPFNKLKNLAEKDELLKEKKSLSLCVYFQICITPLLSISFRQNAKTLNNTTANSILQTDTNTDNESELSINKNFYSNAKTEPVFKNILEAIMNFLTTYLTSQLLEDVHADEKNYGSLSSWSDTFINSEKNDQIFLTNIPFTVDDSQCQALAKDDEEKIKNGQYRDLLAILLQNKKITFYEDKNNKKKHYLFANLFNFYQFFEGFYQELLPFMQNNPTKYNPETIQKMQTDHDKVNNLLKPSA